MAALFDPLARLRVWSPLSSHEASFVEQTASDAHSELIKIKKRIQDLENELFPLRAQHLAFEKVIHAGQGLRAPVRCLPLELLLEVFSHCTETVISCSDPEDDPESDSESGSEPDSEIALRLNERTVQTFHVPAAVLCQVCTTWNSILSTSSFAWSRISLSMDVASLYKDDGSIIEWAEEKLEAALARSGEFPLRFSVNMAHLAKDFVDYRADVAYTRLIDLLFKDSHRWKAAELDLEDDHSDLGLMISEALTYPMPWLQSFTMLISKKLAMKSIVQRSPSCDSPSLQHLSINPYGLLLLSPPQWSQLHSLALIGPSDSLAPLSQAFDVLAACASLTVLRWDCPLTENKDERDRSPVLMPRIQALDVSDTFNPLIPYLSFPHLADFHFHTRYRSYFNQDFTDLAQRLDVVRDKITSLAVNFPEGHGAFHIADVWKSLGHLPEVKHLSLRHIPVAEIHSDNRFSDSSQRFPKLQSLSYNLLDLGLGRSTDYAIPGVLALVRAFSHPKRNAGRDPLVAADGLQARTFPVLRNLMIRAEALGYRAKDATVLREDDIQTLREFIAAGLDVIVQDYRPSTGSVDANSQLHTCVTEGLS